MGLQEGGDTVTVSGAGFAAEKNLRCHFGSHIVDAQLVSDSVLTLAGTDLLVCP